MRSRHSESNSDSDSDSHSESHSDSHTGSHNSHSNCNVPAAGGLSASTKVPSATITYAADGMPRWVSATVAVSLTQSHCRRTGTPFP